jgi:hypothetical protein
MNELIIETGDSPEVHIDAHGQLSVKAWDRNEVRARSKDENLGLKKDGEHVTVSSDSPLDLRVPANSSLVVNAYDEAAIQGVQGGVKVDHASSSLTLKDLGTVEVDLVGDDLNARSIGGELSARQVGRFSNIKEVSGDLKVEFIGAHLNLKNAYGNVAAEAGGNVNLYLDPQPGREIRVKAKGVLTCRVPPGLNARVKLTSSGPIKVKTSEKREVSHEGGFESTFGEGEALLELQANGPITLVESGEKPSAEFDFSFGEDIGNIASGLGEQVSEQIASQMQMMEEQLEAQMAGFTAMMETWDLSPEKAERIQERTQEKIARAQEKIKRAQERASRKIEQAQRRAERKARKAAARAANRYEYRRNRSVDLGGRRRSESEPVSDEERMMILNMLAEKKIGLEEAEALLAALEGK